MTELASTAPMEKALCLFTKCSWRSLQLLCNDYACAHGKKLPKAHASLLKCVSIPPYADSDTRTELNILAKANPDAACALALHKASLTLALKNATCNNLRNANSHAYESIKALISATTKLGFPLSPDFADTMLSQSAWLVNALSSQSELKSLINASKIHSRLYFILGMHRSGTSALTGMLAQSGFAAPKDPMPATERNPKGYWESLRVFNLNEQFLSQLNSHWSSHISLPKGWAYSGKAREWRSALAESFAYAYQGGANPLIKDPRFSILIAGLEPWFESTLAQFIFLIPIRHPVEVANSLCQAESISASQCIRLWIKSVYEAELATRGRLRLFIRYEDLIENPLTVLSQINQLTECQATSDKKRSPSIGDKIAESNLANSAAFIEPLLRHQQPQISYEIYPATDTASLEKLAAYAAKIYDSFADINTIKDISSRLDELRSDDYFLMH